METHVWMLFGRSSWFPGAVRPLVYDWARFRRTWMRVGRANRLNAAYLAGQPEVR